LGTIHALVKGHHSRIHKTLRVTPAMAACVTDRLWSISVVTVPLGSQAARGGLMTKKLFHDPQHWHDRAEDARQVAAQILDPISRRKMLEIAESYKSLARRAAKRLNEPENSK
jgi:hypothetical protein